MRGGDRGEEEKEIGNMEEQEKDEQLPEGWEYARNVKAIWPPSSKEETRKINNYEQMKTLEERLREATEAILKGKKLPEGVKWEGKEEGFEEIYAEWVRGIKEVLEGVSADTTRCVYPPDEQKDEGAYWKGQIQGTNRGGKTGGTNGRGWKRLVQRHRAPRVVGAQRKGGCRRFPGTCRKQGVWTDCMGDRGYVYQLMLREKDDLCSLVMQERVHTYKVSLLSSQEQGGFIAHIADTAQLAGVEIGAVLDPFFRRPARIERAAGRWAEKVDAGLAKSLKESLTQTEDWGADESRNGQRGQAGAPTNSPPQRTKELSAIYAADSSDIRQMKLLWKFERDNSFTTPRP
uniref:Uncharacterized protein n=1 Tax=Chromera velia CCMP2878 TaxID=1169474 RepID=A0A0G4GNJ9_9ALVE|eukprot:Cvel_4971.t1-p1 / transcript=Cvel_4971.t1 / gene=Cvel_4971 / organism=Chromera_velia_CCMP2878 / gene_product=hypothetical protein / transcript_product=hypothetical protein / location=Cvel_scaffold225:801-7037(-) / protein_length=345 / sequence_SO=supercontig / SO=protein_coding / is_pseudo=false